VFERFTKFGKAAFFQAGEEARRLNRPSVGPEHIFLGVVFHEEGVAGRVLALLGVTIDAARENVEALAGRGDGPVQGEIHFSPEGKRVLALALDEARRLGHNYLGTEHMLLALFQFDDGPDGVPILDVMKHFRLRADRVRDLIMQELGRRLATSLSLPGGARLSLPGGTRNNVVMCRVNNPDLEAIDTLVEAGVRATRSDAAAWLIHAGIEGNKPLFERLQATVREIRRLREQAQAITQEVASGLSPAPPAEGGEAPSEGEARPDL
jgi:hypothetical protein